MSLVHLLLALGLLTLGKWLLFDDDFRRPSRPGGHGYSAEGQGHPRSVVRRRAQIRTLSWFARKPRRDTSAECGA